MGSCMSIPISENLRNEIIDSTRNNSQNNDNENNKNNENIQNREIS